jgi:hypothetical protein
MNHDARLVDCDGIKVVQPEFQVHAGERTWRFVVSSSLKRRMTFHYGMFINGAAHDSRVLRYPRERRICGLFESPVNHCYEDIDRLIERFPIIFTHQRQLLDRGEPFQQLMFGTNWVGVADEQDSVKIRDSHPPKSKLVSFIGNVVHPQTGAYALRTEVAKYLLDRPDVDCYGKGIREVPSKLAALAEYRFSVAMENAARDYYFSEKLVDCLLLETVPIYYGCPQIGEMLDPQGILAFSNLDELHDILDRVSPQLYSQMKSSLISNKLRVIEKGWHSHLGLFTRVAERLSAHPHVSNPERTFTWLNKVIDALRSK